MSGHIHPSSPSPPEPELGQSSNIRIDASIVPPSQGSPSWADVLILPFPLTEPVVVSSGEVSRDADDSICSKFVVAQPMPLAQPSCSSSSRKWSSGSSPRHPKSTAEIVKVIRVQKYLHFFTDLLYSSVV